LRSKRIASEYKSAPSCTDQKLQFHVTSLLMRKRHRANRVPRVLARGARGPAR